MCICLNKINISESENPPSLVSVNLSPMVNNTVNLVVKTYLFTFSHLYTTVMDDGTDKWFTALLFP